MLYLCAFLSLFVLHALSTPLDDYVWKDDSNYGWVDTGEVIHGHNVDGTLNYVGYILNMTSQRWLTDADTTRSLWWHYLVVIVPSNYNKDTHNNGTLWITDGDNESPEELPTRFNYNMLLASELAMGTGLITGCLFQVPNEKMVFSSDPIQKRRGEDAIIAFTWAHFLDHPDEPEWLVRLPMVKASVRAMDAITEFTKQKLHVQIDYYTVSGASKRGWTTWLVGAVDNKRVQCIVPIVLDAINFVKVEKHQFRSYGGWAYALSDYYEQNITKRYDDPNMLLLQQIEDPYFYVDRLTMPKMIINGVGDEFQQPDDTHYWWSDMPEPKYFLMMPNTDHSTIAGMLQEIPAMGTFIVYVLQRTPLPTASWNINEANGDITATIEYPSDMSPRVENVTMWYGKTCTKGETGKRRDFRYSSMDDPCECGVISDGTCMNTYAWGWKSKLLSPNADGSYTAHVDADTEGAWTGFFIDFTFEKYKPNEGLGNWPFDPPGCMDFTTEVSIWPNTFPYEECTGEECYGTLL
jgi:PhoPQ-activated pathogenicity-related protein